VVLTGLTILWSVLPDRSWNYFNRGLAYFAFALVGAFAGSALSSRAGAWLIGSLVGVTCPLGLGGEGRACSVRGLRAARPAAVPVGYWNALALVMVFGLPIALWVDLLRAAQTRGCAPEGSSACTRC
jgi:hypothetical protein